MKYGQHCGMFGITVAIEHHLLTICHMNFDSYDYVKLSVIQNVGVIATALYSFLNKIKEKHLISL